MPLAYTLDSASFVSVRAVLMALISVIGVKASTLFLAASLVAKASSFSIILLYSRVFNDFRFIVSSFLCNAARFFILAGNEPSALSIVQHFNKMVNAIFTAKS